MYLFLDLDDIPEHLDYQGVGILVWSLPNFAPRQILTSCHKNKMSLTQLKRFWRKRFLYEISVKQFCNIQLILQNGKDLTVSGTHLLIATGRIPNTDTLDLNKAGIDVDDSEIKVDLMSSTPSQPYLGSW